MFVLYSQNYAARALLILFSTPQKILLKSSYPKKILAKFSYPKNPGIKNFKPQKVLRSSPSLEIPSTPPGNEGEDVNKKPRRRRKIAEHSEGNADNKRLRNRRLESETL